MALVLEHLAEFKEADRLFARAANLAPDLYPLPIRIDEEQFEAAAAEALRSLPEEICSYVRKCPILIEDLPSQELVRSENLSPQVLGLFSGLPVTEPGAESTPREDTDRILLFKRNLEKVAVDQESLVEQIQITVKHEIGHFLGLDEEEVERLGLG